MLKGKKVLIRTVTMYACGLVIKVTKSWIFLDSAAWIADVGRFSNALEKMTFEEVEPIPDRMVFRVSRGSIVDLIELGDSFALPRAQK